MPLTRTVDLCHRFSTFYRSIKRWVKLLSQASLEKDEWERIIYHEAGHAAMALFLWQETADMYLYRKQNDNGIIEKTAKYKITTGFSMNLPGEPQPANKSGIDQVMVTVAGAMVERIKYETESDGCKSDLAKVKTITTHHNDKDALEEIENDFPLSFKQTKEIFGLVDVIAEAAIKSFTKNELIDKDFQEELILDKSLISELYKATKHSAI